jgi:glycosyltransferase involved in cell wall biosynthesis
VRISVVVPLYNNARYVRQAVESALQQPETGQVIIVDDGSTDDSLAVAGRLAAADARVQVLAHPGGANHGAAASRNLGLAAARCEYVAFLDADDYYLPGRFRAAGEVLESDPRIDGVYDAIGTLHDDPEVSRWYRSRAQPELLTLARPVPPDLLFEALVAGRMGYFHTDGIVVRSGLLARTGPFETSLRMGEDTAMWVRMSAVGRLAAGCLDRPVGMRRLHGANTVYQGREFNRGYAVQMAESLLRWAREERLPRRRVILLVDWLFNFHLEPGPAGSWYLRRKAGELGFYAGFAARHPLAMRSRHFWGVVGRTLGSRHMSRALDLWPGKRRAGHDGAGKTAAAPAGRASAD